MLQIHSTWVVFAPGLFHADAIALFSCFYDLAEIHVGVDILNLGEIFEYAHLRFMVSGQSKQANKQAYTCINVNTWKNAYVC